MSTRIEQLIRISQNVLSDAKRHSGIPNQRLFDDWYSFVNENFDENDKDFSIQENDFYRIFTSNMFFLEVLNPIELEYAPDTTVICMVVTHFQKHGVMIGCKSLPSYLLFERKFGSELNLLNEIVNEVDELVDEIFLEVRHEKKTSNEKEKDHSKNRADYS